MTIHIIHLYLFINLDNRDLLLAISIFSGCYLRKDHLAMSTINPLRFLPWPFPPVQAEKLPFGLPLAPNDGFFPRASDVQNPIGILCCNGYWAPNVWRVPVEFSVQPILGMVPKVFVFRNQKSLCLWPMVETINLQRYRY